MTKRQTLLLLALILLSLAALTAVVYIPMYGAAVIRSAAASPVGQLSLLVMVGGAGLIGVLCLVLRRCTQRPHAPLGRFFRDEGGTAAVEMLLALPVILIVVLLILQGTIMWNSNVVFHYAVFGTARSMSSVIPSYLEDSGEGHCMMYAMWDQPNAELSPDSLKYYQIRLAAVAALVPISGRLPANLQAENPYMSGEDFAEAVRQAMSTAQADDEPWFNRVAQQYTWADYFLDLEIDQPEHWEYGEPERGRRCPYHKNRREWGGNDWTYPPYCPNILIGVLDYPPWETVKIGMSYPIELGVPWAGKMMHSLIAARAPELVEEVTLPGSGQTSYLLWLDKELEFILSG